MASMPRVIIVAVVLAALAGPMPVAEGQTLDMFNINPLIQATVDVTQAILNSIGWRMNVTNKLAAKQQNYWYKWGLKGRQESVTSNSSILLASWWTDFKQVTGKQYPSGVAESAAQKAWLDNLEAITKLNDNLNTRFWVGPNEYLDNTISTLKAKLLMQSKPIRKLNVSTSLSSTGRKMLWTSGYPLLPTGRDWKWRNKVPPVKNQGMCGSCWAFAASTAIESAYLINVLKDLSLFYLFSPINLAEQQLLDCDTPEYGGYSNGCDGGFADTAMDLAYRVGQVLDDVYPYRGTQGKCTVSAPNILGKYIKLGGLESVWYPKQNDTLALMRAVDIQPVVTYMEASPAFIAYSGGVFNPTPDLCGTAVNHAVTIVGYSWVGDFTGSTWLIQNSWGKTWGEEGMMRVAMQPPGPGACGMYMYTMAPSMSFQVKLPLL